MCVGTYLKDTLQRIIDSKLFTLFEFIKPDQQCGLFNFLKAKNPTLYCSLDESIRTIFIRETGDNFRGSARYPTEQTSFSVLNMKQILQSPHSQFISSLWRGAESRENLELHLASHFIELEDAVKNSLEVMVENKPEKFNIVIFLCTDLGFLEKILGKCSTTSKYSCFWCTKEILKWSDTIISYEKLKILRQ